MKVSKVLSLLFYLWDWSWEVLMLKNFPGVFTSQAPIFPANVGKELVNIPGIAGGVYQH